MFKGKTEPNRLVPTPMDNNGGRPLLKLLRRSLFRKCCTHLLLSLHWRQASLFGKILSYFYFLEFLSFLFIRRFYIQLDQEHIYILFVLMSLQNYFLKINNLIFIFKKFKNMSFIRIRVQLWYRTAATSNHWMHFD